MSEYIVTVNGEQLSVELLSQQGTELKFAIGSDVYNVDVAPVFKGAGHTDTAANSDMLSGDNSLKAPMPGIVADIMVKEGQQINSGDPLLILEAMKMENNIPSPVSGVITRIHVKKGAEVNSGQLLVEFE